MRLEMLKLFAFYVPAWCSQTPGLRYQGMPGKVLATGCSISKPRAYRPVSEPKW